MTISIHVGIMDSEPVIISLEACGRRLIASSFSFRNWNFVGRSGHVKFVQILQLTSKLIPEHSTRRIRRKVMSRLLYNCLGLDTLFVMVMGWVTSWILVSQINLLDITDTTVVFLWKPKAKATCRCCGVKNPFRNKNRVCRQSRRKIFEDFWDQNSERVKCFECKL